MPAAAWLAPEPAAPLSKTVTLAPRWASRQAMARPITPAPMMATVGDEESDPRSFIGGFLRWHDPDRFDGFDLSREGSRHPRPWRHFRRFCRAGQGRLPGHGGQFLATESNSINLRRRP